MKTKTLSLQEQAEKILELAEARGVTSNFFFVTTFKRYQVQINTLTELERAIREDGPLVTKEYVKGRANTYVNPAIVEYNKTSNAANGTVSTLMNIITKLEKEGESDELLDFLGFSK